MAHCSLMNLPSESHYPLPERENVVPGGMTPMPGPTALAPNSNAPVSQKPRLSGDGRPNPRWSIVSGLPAKSTQLPIFIPPTRLPLSRSRLLSLEQWDT